MKALTRKEAIQAMLEGKEATSDEFAYPDRGYCYYSENDDYPFKCRLADGRIDNIKEWFKIKTWRLRKYIPQDKELAYCWDKNDKTFIVICYYDAKNHCVFRYNGERDGHPFDNYAPYKGELPPNVCKPEELED